MDLDPNKQMLRTVTVRDGEPDSSASDVTVRMRNLHLYYGAFRALKAIDLDVLERRITSIIGPSGSGKSSLLRTIDRMNDLIPGSRLEGEVLFEGRNVYDPSLDVVELRKKVGMVFQRPNPFPRSIWENVAYGPQIHGVKGKQRLDEIVETSLKKSALWDEVKDKLKQSGLSLSGGQQQRLCIARALAVEPDILLMDEPASTLDPISTLRIEELMQELKQSYTIVIVTHNMQQAARVSEWTAVLMVDTDRSGILVEYGQTRDVFTTPKDHRTEAYITGRIG